MMDESELRAFIVIGFLLAVGLGLFLWLVEQGVVP